MEIVWTPERLFFFTCLMSGVASIGSDLYSKRVLRPMSVFGGALFFGLLSGGLGMVMYDFVGGKEKPWRVVGCGILVGAKVLKFKDVSNIARRAMGLPEIKGKSDDGKDQF